MPTEKSEGGGTLSSPFFMFLIKTRFALLFFLSPQSFLSVYDKKGIRYNNAMKKEKITFGAGYRIIEFFHGLVLGFLSMIPFLDTERLRESFKDDDIHDSFSARMKGYLNRNVTLFLGSVIGMLCFFYIPLQNLTTIMGKPVYLSLMALSVGFILVDLYLSFRKNELEFFSPFKLIKMMAFFAVGIVLPFLIRLIPFASSFNASLTSNDSLLLLFVLMTLGGILNEFAGFSIGTMLVITSSFFSLSSPLFDVLRGKDIKSYVFFFIIFLVSYVASSIVGYAFKAQGKNEKERSMLNLGLIVSSLYLFYTNQYKNASFEMVFQNETVTKDMKLVLTLTLLALGLIVGLVLSSHCYRFINRKETKDDIVEHPNYLKDTLTKDLEVEDRRHL